MTEEFSEKPHIDLVDDIPSTLPPSNPKIENPNGNNQNVENLQNNDSQRIAPVHLFRCFPVPAVPPQNPLTDKVSDHRKAA